MKNFYRQFIPGLLFLFFLIIPFSVHSLTVFPQTVNYQGYLTDSSGQAITSSLNMTFRLHTTDTGASFEWEETQLINVTNGLFSVELGSITPLDPSYFDNPLYLAITVDSEPEMTPRKAITLTGYAIKSYEANLLDGASATDLDQSAHVIDFSNPHSVTPAQIGAAKESAFTAHAGDPSAHHNKTEKFSEMLGQIDDAQIPSTITRDSELLWNNIGGKPAGFADNIDNDSGGDITGVNAGVGLNGGGTTGNVTLNVDVPLSLTSSSPYTIQATNSSILSGSYGIYGWMTSTSAGGYSAGIRGHNASTTGSGIGIYGTHAGSGWGIYGYSPDGRGLYGNSGSGEGVRGYSLNGIGGYFSSSTGYGLVVANGNVGIGDVSPDGERMTIRGDGSSWQRGFLALKNIGEDAGMRLYNSDTTVAHHIYNDNGLGDKLRIAPEGNFGSGGMTVEQAGYVGVNTTNPNSMLHVNGDGVDPSFRAQVSGATKLFVAANGAVVVGANTTAPADVELQVINGSDATLTNGSGFQVIGLETGANVVFDDNEIMARNNGVASKLWLNKDSGNVVVPALEITGGADLVEPFNVVNEFKDVVIPGMVMSIDIKHPGEIRVADKEYDRTVAGIISGANGINPGLSMSQQGSKADGSHPLALTGRLFALADASYGMIQPGDMLTTSKTPGHVMKVSDHARAQGAIIGKAMTPLEAGKGHVLVLVSLQ